MALVILFFFALIRERENLFDDRGKIEPTFNNDAEQFDVKDQITTTPTLVTSLLDTNFAPPCLDGPAGVFFLPFDVRKEVNLWRKKGKRTFSKTIRASKLT